MYDWLNLLQSNISHAGWRQSDHLLCLTEIASRIKPEVWTLLKDKLLKDKVRPWIKEQHTSRIQIAWKRKYKVDMYDWLNLLQSVFCFLFAIAWRSCKGPGTSQKNKDQPWIKEHHDEGHKLLEEKGEEPHISCHVVKNNMIHFGMLGTLKTSCNFSSFGDIWTLVVVTKTVVALGQAISGGWAVFKILSFSFLLVAFWLWIIPSSFHHNPCLGVCNDHDFCFV